MAESKTITPEQYARTIQSYFADEEWEEGKKLLDEAIGKFPIVSDLQWLAGKYWYNKKEYNQARYYLVKAIEYDYNNVNAKQLLVDVEEITENYSSAICYVNELLEVNPYWEGLWRRKINLYRKQGNEEEAKRLLKRINQIYPNDSILRKDYIYGLEESYRQLRKNGQRAEAIEQLKELMTLSPRNEQYYLDMCNLYLQEGEMGKALEQADIGLAKIPGNIALIYKKAGILGELSRYTESLPYLQNCMKEQHDPRLRSLYSTQLMEYARMEKRKDPYVLYGMAWERGQKDKETLSYLMQTAVARHYTDDALYYLREAARRYGKENKEVLYCEYQLYRDSHDKERAFQVLNRLNQLYPDDSDIRETLCEQHLQRASELMDGGRYTEALPHARFVAHHTADAETGEAAMEKSIACYIGMKRYGDAEAALDTLVLNHPDYADATRKRAVILDKEGRTPEALQLFLDAIDHSSGDERLFYVIGYEELALPFIKQCMEEGATPMAYQTATRLVALNPWSDDGLRYAISSSDLLGKDDDFRSYTTMGFRQYPDARFYRVKQAIVYQRSGNYTEALALLQPMLHTYPDNQELTGAFSTCSEAFALQRSKERKNEEAIALLDTALRYDRNNTALKYAKGVVYEACRQPDSAYYYQRFYLPSRMEEASFRQHLKGLEHRIFRNEVALTYLRARYGESDAVTSLATAEYTRITPQNSYTGSIHYAGRSGPDKEQVVDGELIRGGVGVRLQAEWMHRFSEYWSGRANIAWANRYFPQITAGAAVTRYLRNDWEVGGHAGYRKVDTGMSLLTVGADLAKTLEVFRLTSRFDLHLYNSKLYYNLQAGAAYYPLDDMHTRIFATAGIGSAPETVSLDQALPGSFAHINAQLGMGGQYLLTAHVTVGLTGTWQTYCNFMNQYKNLYNIYVQLYLSF
jgi:tetratricopeptide (TPR) repeat protein